MRVTWEFWMTDGGEELMMSYSFGNCQDHVVDVDDCVVDDGDDVVAG